MTKNRFALYLAIIAIVIFITITVGETRSRQSKNTESKQSGRRALLVGTDVYKNFPNKPTPGAEEDIRATRSMLIEKYGFQGNEIEVLLRENATAHNIREAFKRWLIEGTKPGDKVYFHYSGHGTTVEDEDGDEARRTPGDTRDEALAPYDVGDTPNSLILDDELGLLINQLSGRMAVLVFDSCFSGTVTRGSKETASASQQATPRYLPPLEDMKKLVTRSGGKGIADDYVVLPPASGSRDLNLVVDKESIKAGGIVIFSAAQPHQFAYSIPAKPGYQRGALSYLLNQYMDNPEISLGELKSKIASGMAAFHRSNILKPDQEQDPYFEVFSAVPLEDQPLFGGDLTTPAVALTNPVSTIKLSIRTLEKSNVYYFGTRNGTPYNETVSYEVQTSEPGYLYLIVFSEGNVATRIFPNAEQRNNQVQRGTHEIYRDPVKKEGFWVTEPEGKDIVVALLSSSKLNFGQDKEYETERYSWDEVFALLKSRRFSEQVERLRGQTSKGQATTLPLDMTRWQSASIVLEARRINE